MTTKFKGSCLCQAVQYELTGPLRDSVGCHCTQCRKTTGHYLSATQVNEENLRITKAEGLRWYRSSPEAERGFCQNCGSSLFWRQDGEGKVSVLSGTIDDPTGIKEEKHIFAKDKGDYYDLPANVEVIQEW